MDLLEMLKDREEQITHYQNLYDRAQNLGDENERVKIRDSYYSFLFDSYMSFLTNINDIEKRMRKTDDLTDLMTLNLIKKNLLRIAETYAKSLNHIVEECVGEFI
jgi:hypothetical protein